MAFSDRANAYIERVEATLNQWLPAESSEPQRLHAALRYAVFNGGKRIRPLLAFAAAEAVDLPPNRADRDGGRGGTHSLLLPGTR